MNNYAEYVSKLDDLMQVSHSTNIREDYHDIAAAFRKAFEHHYNSLLVSLQQYRAPDPDYKNWVVEFTELVEAMRKALQVLMGRSSTRDPRQDGVLSNNHKFVKKYLPVVVDYTVQLARQDDDALSAQSKIAKRIVKSKQI